MRLALADRSRSIDLLITDYLMPAMTGDELIARMREQQPNLEVFSSSPDTEITQLDRESPDWWRDVAHLAKPFRIQALRDAVENLLTE